MTLWSKLRAWARPTEAPKSDDPIAQLDHALTEMQTARDTAREHLARAPVGHERAELEAAVDKLESRIDEASQKRAALVARIARIEEQRALTKEMRDVIAQVLAVPHQERESEGARELRARAAELQAKAEELKRQPE